MGVIVSFFQKKLVSSVDSLQGPCLRKAKAFQLCGKISFSSTGVMGAIYSVCPKNLIAFLQWLETQGFEDLQVSQKEEDVGLIPFFKALVVEVSTIDLNLLFKHQATEFEDGQMLQVAGKYREDILEEEAALHANDDVREIHQCVSLLIEFSTFDGDEASHVLRLYCRDLGVMLLSGSLAEQPSFFVRIVMEEKRWLLPIEAIIADNKSYALLHDFEVQSDGLWLEDQMMAALCHLAEDRSSLLWGLCRSTEGIGCFHTLLSKYEGVFKKYGRLFFTAFLQGAGKGEKESVFYLLSSQKEGRECLTLMLDQGLLSPTPFLERPLIAELLRVHESHLNLGWSVLAKLLLMDGTKSLKHLQQIFSAYLPRYLEKVVGSLTATIEHRGEKAILLKHVSDVGIARRGFVSMVLGFPELFEALLCCQEDLFLNILTTEVANIPKVIDGGRLGECFLYSTAVTNALFGTEKGRAFLILVLKGHPQVFDKVQSSLLCMMVKHRLAGSYMSQLSRSASGIEVLRLALTHQHAFKAMPVDQGVLLYEALFSHVGKVWKILVRAKCFDLLCTITPGLEHLLLLESSARECAEMMRPDILSSSKGRLFMQALWRYPYVWLQSLSIDAFHVRDVDPMFLWKPLRVFVDGSPDNLEILMDNRVFVDGSPDNLEILMDNRVDVLSALIRDRHVDFLADCQKIRAFLKLLIQSPERHQSRHILQRLPLVFNQLFLSILSPVELVDTLSGWLFDYPIFFTLQREAVMKVFEEEVVCPLYPEQYLQGRFFSMLIFSMEGQKWVWELIKTNPAFFLSDVRRSAVLFLSPRREHRSALCTLSLSLFKLLEEGKPVDDQVGLLRWLFGQGADIMREDPDLLMTALSGSDFPDQPFVFDLLQQSEIGLSIMRELFLHCADAINENAVIVYDLFMTDAAKEGEPRMTSFDRWLSPGLMQAGSDLISECLCTNHASVIFHDEDRLAGLLLEKRSGGLSLLESLLEGGSEILLQLFSRKGLFVRRIEQLRAVLFSSKEVALKSPGSGRFSLWRSASSRAEPLMLFLGRSKVCGELFKLFFENYTEVFAGDLEMFRRLLYKNSLVNGGLSLIWHLTHEDNDKAFLALSRCIPRCFSDDFPAFRAQLDADIGESGYSLLNHICESESSREQLVLLFKENKEEIPTMLSFTNLDMNMAGASL